MSRLSEQPPEHRRHEEVATLLLNRIALRLIQDARFHGGFGEDEEPLLSRAADLAEELGGDPDAEAEGGFVELELRSGGRIELVVPFGDGFRVSAELREDGVVLGGGTSEPSITRTLRPEEMKPWEKEEHDRREAAREAAREKPKFRGERYLQTLAASPQPGSRERILAIQLYDDGLIIEFSYDTDPPTEEQMESMFYPPRPPMRVEDDVGTDYCEASEGASYGGGPGVSHSHFTFAPALPEAASLLRITTDSGMVEIPIQS